MTDPPIRNIDLNLLQIFDIIFEERNLTHAAVRLNLTPSAISHSLRRLRGIMDDPLFIREPQGMRPTARAIDIAPRIRQSLKQLQQAWKPSLFNPLETTRRFVVSASPYICWCIMPRVMRRLCKEAPHAELAIWRRTVSVIEDLDRSRVDIAIGIFVDLPEQITAATLLMDDWVWVVRAGNPHVGETLDEATLSNMSLVTVSAGQGLPLDTNMEYSSLKSVLTPSDFAWTNVLIEGHLRKNMRINMPDAMSALAVTAESDMASLVPRRLAEALAGHYGLRIFPSPRPIAPANFMLATHAVHGMDQGVLWLTDLIRQATAEI